MNKVFDTIKEHKDAIVKIVLSNTQSEVKKIIVRPVHINQKTLWQVEKYIKTQVFHSNIEFDDIFLLPFTDYTQILIETVGENIQFIKKKTAYSKNITNNNINKISYSHNKTKDYIIKEDEENPVLIDLGVFTKENKIVKAMYDKYKQINKFLEIIDDKLKNYNNQDITILDFGCGKSYLTFVLYWYFVEKKKLNAKIIGYDLKEDVVNNCNRLAKQYNYSNIEFIKADVSKDTLFDKHIDMIVSLHACDTATDYALHYAISHNVKYIFSVPCCQHEINNSIKDIGDFNFLLKDGLIKERFSALLTDSIRVELLRALGYKVDVIEFVDLSHTPKNLMIRAEKSTNKKDTSKVNKLLQKYNFSQTLNNLLTK